MDKAFTHPVYPRGWSIYAQMKTPVFDGGFWFKGLLLLFENERRDRFYKPAAYTEHIGPFARSFAKGYLRLPSSGCWNQFHMIYGLAYGAEYIQAYQLAAQHSIPGRGR